MAHGFGKDIVEKADEAGFSNSFMMELAGNSFAATIPAAIELAILANLPDAHVELLTEVTKPRRTSTGDGANEKADADVDGPSDGANAADPADDPDVQDVLAMLM